MKADNDVLKTISGLSFCFESDNADMSIDEFEFTVPEQVKKL